MSKSKAAAPGLDEPEHSWEQQPGESTKAWSNFRRYRDMPPEQRSLSALALELSVAKQSMTQMSVRHDWQARVRAYDRHIDRAAQRKVKEEVERISRNNVLIVLSVQMKLAARLKTLGADEISAKAMPTYLRALAAMETAIRGARVEHSGPDGAPIEFQDVGNRERLAAILSDPTPTDDDT